jgi:hypothetical protein
MRALFTLALALFCAVSQLPASAQDRDSAYVVSGVPAEAEASNSAEARSLAFANAYRLGFERLVRRLTLAADFARVGVPQAPPAQLEALVASVDVESERRSGSRYLGRVTLRFDQANARALLRNAGYAPIETRSAPILVAAQAPDAAPETAELWRTVWAESGYASELVPLPAVLTPIDGLPDWRVIEPFARNARANSALYVSVRMLGQTAIATLTEIGPNSRRDRGTVQARVQGGDLRAAFVTLAAQTNDQIQNEWKAQAAASASGGGRLAASALYDSEAEWERIKQGLERAAATLISEIRIEAVARRGALVSFSYSGGETDLVTELRRQGVSLENAELGPVLRAAGR